MSPLFKSIMAREIVRRKPAVKRALWGGEFWADGHSVATGGERANWETVERYVHRQGQPQEDLRQYRGKLYRRQLLQALLEPAPFFQVEIPSTFAHNLLARAA
jgi:Transposase IS200 like